MTEMDDEILYQKEMKSLTEEEAQKYSELWIKLRKEKGWRTPILFLKCTLAYFVVFLLLIAYLNSLPGGAVYASRYMLAVSLFGVVQLLLIMVIAVRSQKVAKKVVSYKEQPYQRCLCMIVEGGLKYKPICVRYVMKGEIQEEYFYYNYIDTKLQKGKFATFIEVDGTPGTLFSQDISWAKL